MEIRRVEYIDALRGFCMILVVMYHVGMFSYGMALPKSYYHVFNFFMLPLFFFVILMLGILSSMNGKLGIGSRSYFFSSSFYMQ